MSHEANDQIIDALESEFEVLCDDGEETVLLAETFDEAFNIALELGYKPVSVKYA